MANILFWNAGINKCKDDDEVKVDHIDNCIIDLIVEKNCDLVILAEYQNDLENLCNKISLHGRDFKVGSTIQETRIKLIFDTRFDVEIIRDNPYFFIFNISFLEWECLLSGVHLPSKIRADEDDQELVGAQFKMLIEESERAVGHNKIIIVGDFNANPYEKIMTKANMFHAIPNASIVENKKSRVAYSDTWHMFYNPMWNFLGDKSEPNGTIKYDAGGAINMYWNLFDQSLFSADMIKYLINNSVQIVTGVKGYSLLDKNGFPNKKEFSDHLPIFFEIKEDM
jgi:hypothetical protein